MKAIFVYFIIGSVRQDPSFHWSHSQRADRTEMEAVALDEEPLVELDLLSRVFIFVSTNTGIVGRRLSTKLLLLSSTTTSDIVGLDAADA